MENIRIIREKRNKSQLNLAMHVGLTQTQISNYESGRTEPSIDSLIKIAKHLNTSSDYLLGLTEDDTPSYWRTKSELATDELELLTTYFNLALEDQKRVRDFMDALALIQNKRLEEISV